MTNSLYFGITGQLVGMPKVTLMIQGLEISKELEHPSYGERLALLSLEKRRLMRDLILVSKYLV